VGSGSEDGITRVLDLESGEIILVIETGLRDVEAVIYSPDKTMMIATGRKQFIKIWDSDSGNLVAHVDGHTGR
jgi:WD40 repeat protein